MAAFGPSTSFRFSASSRTRTRRRSALRLEHLEDRCVPASTGAYGIGGYGQLPLAFEPNVGQAQPGVDFVARGSGYGIALSPAGAVLSLRPPSGSTADVVALSLVGASAAAAPQGIDRLPGVDNYLVGNDPSQWHTNIPTYARVQAAGVYPGIDAAYYGNQGGLEFDLVVHPGAHPGSVRLAITGAAGLSLDAKGDLVVHTTDGDLMAHAPTVYQENHGTRQAVAARYVLQDGGTVGFAVAGYDATRPLVIDPYLGYSSFLGGSGDDVAFDVAVDASGSAYVTGLTGSSDFPTMNPLQPSLSAGGQDAFIAKINPSGSALEYSTYLGGSDLDNPSAVAVDASGGAYLTGYTSSTDFPTTVGAFQTTHPAGGTSAFVTKLSPDGTSLVYSTYLGGSAFDSGDAIAVDSAGNAYIAGSAASSDFPTTAGAFQTTHSGTDTDGTVTKLSPDGSQLVYSTYLGGTGFDDAFGIAVDQAGNAFVTGDTGSTDFPTAAALQPAFGGGFSDAWVTELAPSGGAVLYSTYLGGSGADTGERLALDPLGQAYVVGETGSSDFPTTFAAFQTAAGGIQDAFATKLAAGGASALYSTYLGGSGRDSGSAIAIDAAGNAYVTGDTQSSDFPTTTNAVQAALDGFSDAYVTKLGPDGTFAGYSTYLGGSGSESGRGIAVDSLQNAYVAGATGSLDFPTTLGAAQTTYGGGRQDAFIARLVTWSGADVAVNNVDHTTQLVWGSGQGSETTWSVPASSQPVALAGPALGPNLGWFPRADAVGPDGLTRILWDNVNGSTAVWTLDATGNFSSAGSFGPIAGWTAQDAIVGTDGLVRVLWSGPNNRGAIWTLDASYNITSVVLQNGGAGFAPLSLAGASDGSFYELWTGAAGQTMVWHLASSGTVQAQATFGPFEGWQAVDLAVGSDDQARILWDNRATGAAALWDLDNALALASSSVYGPVAGWIATRLAGGTDASLRLLWSRPDESAAVYTLGLDGSFQAANVYQADVLKVII